MKQTTLRLPDELHKALKREAGQRGMTLNAHIISVLWSRSETCTAQKIPQVESNKEDRRENENGECKNVK